MADRIRDLLLPIGSSGEERLSHLNVARHSDMRVNLQRSARDARKNLVMSCPTSHRQRRCRWTNEGPDTRTPLKPSNKG